MKAEQVAIQRLGDRCVAQAPGFVVSVEDGGKHPPGAPGSIYKRRAIPFPIGGPAPAPERTERCVLVAQMGDVRCYVEPDGAGHVRIVLSRDDLWQTAVRR